MSGRVILAIDQGTTSTRCVLFDDAGRSIGTAQRELTQHYPGDGMVEHDPEDIWRDTLDVMRSALATSGLSAGDVAAIGITNQRETVIVWDRATGKPLHRAIVWQDRRTAAACDRLRCEGHEALVVDRTGLLLDPYFSASKIAWILDHVPGARNRAEAGELAFGTVDTFLLWRLTEGAVHATDVTNASRTLLFDIVRQQWDADLLDLFGIPAAMLPVVRDNCADFGITDLLGSPIPICGIAGDQQAALIGHAGFARGSAKATYGTGCFMLLNVGDAPVRSSNRLLSTIAHRIDGKTAYAMEGATFVAGAAVRWLRDGLGLIEQSAEVGVLAAQVPDNGGVYLVPAFVGLGAPYWDPRARGLITGLTLGTGAAHIARATLEAVGYQTWDLVSAMMRDHAAAPIALRVDGGMAASDWLCQFLADILQVRVERPATLESTALGAAFLAGMHIGFWKGRDGVAALPQALTLFEPRMDAATRAELISGWSAAVAKVLL